MRKYGWLTALMVICLVAVVLVIFLLKQKPARDVEESLSIDKAAQKDFSEPKHRWAKRPHKSIETQTKITDIEDTTAISGIIVSKEGRPLENVDVYVVAWFGDRSYDSLGNKGPHNISDERGEFVLKDLKDTGIYNLWVYAEEFVGKQVTASPGTSGLKIILGFEATVSGRILCKETGEPVADVCVSSVITMENDDYYFQTRSDTEGFYKLDGLSDSIEYIFEAKSQDYISDTVTLTLLERENKENFDIYVYPSLFISGYVKFHDTGEPAEGVNLWLCSLSHDGEIGRSYEAYPATSDTEGYFKISGMREGDYELSVEGKHKLFSEDDGLSEIPIEVVKDEQHELIFLEVLVTRTLHVFVTDEDGKPIPDAEVTVSNNVSYFDHSAAYPEGGQHIDGKYEFYRVPLGKEEIKISCTHDDYVVYEESVNFEQDELEKTVDIVLSKGLSIAGYVSEVDSSPIASAKVKATGNESTDYLEREAQSDSEGYFAIIGITAGRWNLQADKEGYGTAQLENIEVMDTDITDINFMLKPGTSISGIMYFGRDVPLEHDDLLVYLATDRSDPFPRLHRDIWTDSEGYFTIADLPPGKYDIEFSLYKWVESDTKILVRFSKDIENVKTGTEDLIVQFGDFGSIAGQVLDGTTMQPVKRFSIRVWLGGGSDRGEEFPRNGTPPESFDGRFIITHLEPETYRLVITAPRYEKTEVADINVAENEVTWLEPIQLKSGARIIGRLISGESDQPVPGAGFYLYDNQSLDRFPDFPEGTGYDGRFSIENVKAGRTYNLYISHNKYASKTIDSIAPAAGETINLGDIILEKGNSIRGEVTDHLGVPVRNAMVYFRSNRPFVPAESDESGNYVLHGVPAGEVQIICRIPDRLRINSQTAISKKVNIKEGTVNVVNFTFRKGVTVSGIIMNNNVSVSEAIINLHCIDSKMETTMSGQAISDANGEFYLENISPGSYQVYIIAFNRELIGSGISFTYQHHQIVTVSESAEKITISTNNSKVGGRIFDSNGMPAARKRISFKALGNMIDIDDPEADRQPQYLFAVSDNEGRFSAGAITPGRYSVGISLSDKEIKFKPITEIVVEEGIEIDDLEVILPE